MASGQGSSSTCLCSVKTMSYTHGDYPANKPIEDRHSIVQDGDVMHAAVFDGHGKRLLQGKQCVCVDLLARQITIRIFLLLIDCMMIIHAGGYEVAELAKSTLVGRVQAEVVKLKDDCTHEEVSK